MVMVMVMVMFQGREVCTSSTQTGLAVDGHVTALFTKIQERVQDTIGWSCPINKVVIDMNKT